MSSSGYLTTSRAQKLNDADCFIIIVVPHLVASERRMSKEVAVACFRANFWDSLERTYDDHVTHKYNSGRSGRNSKVAFRQNCWRIFDDVNWTELAHNTIQ
jgi:hypothetical protein